MASYPTHPDFAWTYPVSASAYPAAAHALLPGSSVPLSGVDGSKYWSNMTVSPLYAAIEAVRDVANTQPVNGLGAPKELSTGATAALFAGVGILAVVGLAAAAFGGYYTGKAVAPSKASQTTYGLLGIPISWVAGPVGLGALAYFGGRNRELPWPFMHLRGSALLGPGTPR